MANWHAINDALVRVVWRCPVCTREVFCPVSRTHAPSCLGDEEGTLAGQKGPGRAHQYHVTMEYVRTEVYG